VALRYTKDVEDWTKHLNFRKRTHGSHTWLSSSGEGVQLSIPLRIKLGLGIQKNTLSPLSPSYVLHYFHLYIAVLAYAHTGVSCLT
jgi:hypothetical protein